MTSPLQPAQASTDSVTPKHDFHAYIIDDERLRSAFGRYVKMPEKDKGKVPVFIENVESLPGLPTYELSRRKVDDGRADMDSDERCRLTLLNTGDIQCRGASTVHIQPEKYSWFAEAGEVFIKKEGKGPEEKMGTLMMLNPHPIHLMKAGVPGRATEDKKSMEKLRENIHQLMEMLSAIARQPHAPKYLKHDGLPKLADSVEGVNDSLGWPLLETVGEPYLDKAKCSPISLSRILADITSLADVVAYLHDQGLAHGDIKLGGLRKIEDKVALGNLERFNCVGVAPGPDTLGEKKYLYYNNSFHAPELRYPGTLGGDGGSFKPWQYTHATKESDVWSFGMLMAQMLCYIPDGVESLGNARVSHSLFDYMASSGMYDSGKLGSAAERDKFLSNKASLLAICRSNKIPVKGSGSPLSDLEKEWVARLTTLIEQCTHPNPAERPIASRVVQALNVIKVSDQGVT